MDSEELNEEICRICLKHNVILNWDDNIFEFSEISYKDCYYKYTQLKETDSDSYPTNLCEICGNGLKNAHILFEKAVESFDILQALLKSKVATKYFDITICNTPPMTQDEDQSFDNVDSTMGDKVINESDDETSSLLYHNEVVDPTENLIDNYEMNDIIIEPEHFIDIQNIKPSADIEITKSLAANKTRNKRKECESIPATFLDQDLSETCNTKLQKSPSTKKTCKRRKKIRYLPENSLQQNHSGSCRTNSTTKPEKRSRAKYLLICAYCSLKVDGYSKLATHEATHNEHRKRTELCPQCGVKLYTKVSLTEHMKTHDENRQKNYECEFCGNAFYNRGSLNVHRRKHLGLMVKCQLCTKEFFRQVDLDRHLVKHSASPLQRNVGKKKYTVQCQYCDKSVLTVKWKSHIAAHQGEPQVKCKICDKNFFSRANCTNHLRRVHLKNSSEYENFMHYYGDGKARVSILMMKQQLSAQPLIDNKISDE